MTQVVIDSKRLQLKSVTPALIHHFFETRSREEIMQYFGADEFLYEDLKTKHELGMETHRFSLYYFLLVEKESGRILGECGFHTWNKTHRRAELFYKLKNEPDKRKGLMTEALNEILDHGFNELKLHRVEALTAHWNLASIKLLTNFGFIKEGTMREDYVVDGKNVSSECYSLLKWEWKKNKGPL